VTGTMNSVQVHKERLRCMKCRFNARESAQLSITCRLILISTFHSQPLSSNQNLRILSNRMLSPHECWKKAIASQALRARKKLHRSPSLLNQPDEHLRNQGMTMPRGSSAEKSEGGLAISSSEGSVFEATDVF